MNCKQIEDLLWFYSEKSLPQDKMESIKMHLQSCDACLHLANEFIKTEQLLITRREIQANPYLYTRLMQRIENEKNTKITFPFSIILRNAVMVSFALVAGVLLGFNLLNHTSWSDSAKSAQQIKVQEQNNDFLYGDIDVAEFDAYFENNNQDKP